MNARPVVAAALLLAATAAPAHKASDSYLRLAVDGTSVSGQWDVALRDLHGLVNLDPDGNGTITWGELEGSRGAVEAALAERLRLDADGEPCLLAFTRLRVDHHGDGAYAVLDLRAACPAAVGILGVGYELLFETDPSHRGLLRLDFEGVHSAVFAPERRAQRFARGGGHAFLQHLKEGAWHVWTGLDHVLFLACLLLPAVVRRERGAWVSAPGAIALRDSVIVVTAFTLAHAATLSLVLLEHLSLPSRWVESLVAATVAFAALNNLVPMVRRRLWLLSAGFGLIHGAAIASVLAALQLPQGSTLVALLGFNLGVEAAQLAVIALWLPLAYALRDRSWYRAGVVGGGSLLVLGVALAWFGERAFELELLPL
jgi:hypothetical protein